MRLIQQRYLVIAGATAAVAASVAYAAAVWSGGQKGSKSSSSSSSSSSTTTTKRVLITGAAGQIAYALAPLIASGQMLGPDTPVLVQLYDVPAAEGLLQGLQLELEDALAAYPLLQGVVATTDFAAACLGVSVAVMCGGVPRRGPGLSKAQLMAANCAIYRDQAAALAAYAEPGVKVVVVASPANTNAWVLQQFAPSIPPQDITALTRLDHNRALQHLAAVLRAHASEVTNVIVFGNHASSQFPYGHLARLRGQPILQQQQQQHQRLDAAELEDYLRNEFITIVQNRGQHINRLRVQLSPALSAAAAVCGHVHDWLLGTRPGEFVSMGIITDANNSYGIVPGLVYSFPVQCNNGSWSIVKGLPIEPWAWARMKLSEADLLEERALALQVLAAAAAVELKPVVGMEAGSGNTADSAAAAAVGLEGGQGADAAVTAADAEAVAAAASTAALAQAAAAVGLPPSAAELPAAAQKQLLGAAAGMVPTTAVIGSTAASAAGSAVADGADVAGSPTVDNMGHVGMSDVLATEAAVASSGADLVGQEAGAGEEAATAATAAEEAQQMPVTK